MEIIGSVMKLVEGGNERLRNMLSKRRRIAEISSKTNRINRFLNDDFKEENQDKNLEFSFLSSKPKPLKISKVIHYEEAEDFNITSS